MTLRQTIKKPKHSHHARRRDLVRSIRLVNFETGEVVTIMPNLGAAVVDLVLNSGKRLHSILESLGSLQEIIDNKHYYGAKLMPFPGRTLHGRYQFGGKSYALRPNTRNGAASIHGFVCRKPFRIVRTVVNDRRASVILEYIHKGGTKGYPFRFSVRLTYALAHRSFSCTTVVRNLDKRAIPMGDGWHPYYKTSGEIKWPLLSLPSHSVVELSGQKVPTGLIVTSTRKAITIPLRRREIDSVLDLGKKRRRVTTKLIDPKSGLELDLGRRREWGDTGFWLFTGDRRERR